MDGVKVRHGPDTEEGPPEQHVFSDIFADAVYAWMVGIVVEFCIVGTHRTLHFLQCVMSTK